MEGMEVLRAWIGSWGRDDGAVGQRPEGWAGFGGFSTRVACMTNDNTTLSLFVAVSEAFFAGANKKLTRDEIRVKLAHMLAPAHQVAPHVDETWPEVDESDALLNMTGSGSASGKFRAKTADSRS